MLETNSEIYFPGIIGQRDALRTLSFYVDAFKMGEVLPHLALIAPKGTGKTTIVNQFGKLLDKPMYSTVGEEWKSIKSVYNQVMYPLLSQQEPFTLFIDEVHGISRTVAEWLLPALAPNKTNKTKLTYLGNELDIDFSQHTFLFGTTERQGIRPALLDRMTEVSLDIYTSSEIAQIIKINMLDVNFEDGALEQLSVSCRGNARSAFKVSQALSSYLKVKGSEVFINEYIEEFMKLMGIFPLGLNKQELLLLKHVADNPKGVNVGTLCALTENTVGALRNMEGYLRKQTLIETGELSKRFLTPKGLEYLRQVRNFEMEKTNEQ